MEMGNGVSLRPITLTTDCYHMSDVVFLEFVDIAESLYAGQSLLHTCLQTTVM